MMVYLNSITTLERWHIFFFSDWCEIRLQGESDSLGRNVASPTARREL